MSVNGVTSNAAFETYKTYDAKTEVKKQTSDASAANKTAAEESAVYEPSTTTQNAKKTYKPDKALIAKLKADAEQRTSQLRSLVEQLMTKQGNTYNKANDIWSTLSSGNFTVDAATKAQAQADIAENGYWGVNQTSSRIIDFATALTGGDPDKIEEMRSAFKKGYEQAEKKWGGKLPDISRQTYDAVMEKFDELAANASTTE